MNKFKNHLLSTMQQCNFARSHELVGNHCKKRIPTFLITLAIVVILASPMVQM